MTRIAILLFDNCMASSVTGPLDLFQISNTVWRRFDAAAEGRLFDCQLVSLDGQPVRCSSGLQLMPDVSLAQMQRPDLLLIGGHHFDSSRALLGQLAAMQPLHRPLARLADDGCLVAGFCSGSFVLAQAGLLDAQMATTSWWLVPLFRRLFPETTLVMDQLVVQSGPVWTAGATTAYTSLCLKLVAHFAGPEVASQVAKVMLVDNNRVSQLPYMSVQAAVGHQDQAIADCQYWLQSHLAEPIDLQTMADRCAMSKRTFIRRFKKAVALTPASYLQQLRIDAAKRYLEHTDKTLEQIIEAIGYDDLSAFRRVFQKLTSVTPGAYRRRFASH